MKKAIVIIGLLILLIFVGFSGCTQKSPTNTNTSNPDKEKFIGTWVNSSGDYSITFLSNGTYRSPNRYFSGTWDIKDGQLILDYTIFVPGVRENICNYSFSNHNTNLTISDITYPNPLQLRKQ